MNENLYRSIFRKASFGYACHEILTDSDGKPVDYRFLDVNRVFEDMTGLSATSLKGKTVGEVLPEIQNEIFDWDTLYENINPDGGPEEFEQYSEPLKKWYKVIVQTPEKGYLLILFDDVTRMKRLEQSLLTRTHAIDTSVTAMALAEPDGALIYINKAFMEMWNQKKEKDVIGKNAVSFWSDPDDALKVIEELNSKNFWKGEMHASRQDGSEFTVLVSASLVRNSKGEVQNMMATFIDITERKQAEDRIRESEDKYRSLTSHLPVGVYRTTLDGQLVYLNPDLAKMLDYDSVEELSQLNVNQLYVNLSDREKQLESSKKTSEVIQSEFQLKKKSGELIWVRDNSRLIVDENGKPEYFDGVLEDITAHKTADKALHESERKLLATLKANPDTMFRFDRKGSFLDFHFNREHDLLLDPSSLIGSDIRDHFSEELADKMIYSIDRCLKTGKMQTLEYSLFMQGTTRYYEARYVPVDKDEVLGFSREITEQKRKERELLEAKEKAEESDRLKSVFLANVSHEIRTPMNAIIGFMELLNNPDLKGEEKNSYIQIINQSGQRLLSTINDIIEISKIESGQSAVVYSDVNVREMMQFHYGFFRQKSLEKGVLLRLSEQITGKKDIIQTDRHKLDGILTNLINNAVKFTQQGSIEIGNYIHGNYLVFFVRDTGQGIQEDRLEAIFDRFVQADLKKNRPHEGSGLGLSIARAYAEMLGGKIWVKSEIGKGSTFFFSIPLIPVEKEKSKYDKSEIRPDNFKKDITVLIAEDDEYSYKYLESILSDEGIKFLRTINGEDTIRALKENPEISIILMDFKMPVMDGFEATRQIRKFNKKIPIIAQTAYALAGDKEKALEAGCNDYISKPITRDELIRQIYKYTEIDNSE